MDKQPDLFDKQPDLFDVGKRAVGPKAGQKTCTPAMVGSGPPDETCGTCMFKRKRWNNGGRKYWLKCRLMSHCWTNGGGSDIKARWRACRYWRPKNVVYVLAVASQYMPAKELKTKDGCLLAADHLEEHGKDKLARAVRGLAYTNHGEELDDLIAFQPAHPQVSYRGVRALLERNIIRAFGVPSKLISKNNEPSDGTIPF